MKDVFFRLCVGLAVVLPLVIGCAPNYKELGDRAYGQGDYKTAAENYKYLAVGGPKDGPAKVKKELNYTLSLGDYGAALYRAGDCATAENMLQRCLTVNRSIKGILGQTVKAASKRKYRFTDWENKMVHVYLGRVYEAMDQREKSLIEYRNINESEDRTFMIAHYRMGTLFQAKGASEDAVIGYRNTLKSNEDIRTSNKYTKSKNREYKVSPFAYAYLDLGLGLAAKGGEWRSEAVTNLEQFLASIGDEPENAKLAQSAVAGGASLGRTHGSCYITMDVPYYSYDCRFKVMIDGKYYGESMVLEDMVEHKWRYEFQFKKVAKEAVKEVAGALARKGLSEIPCVGGIFSAIFGDPDDMNETRAWVKGPSMVHGFKTYLPEGDHKVEVIFADSKTTCEKGGCKKAPVDNPYVKHAKARFVANVTPGSLTVFEYDPPLWVFNSLGKNWNKGLSIKVEPGKEASGKKTPSEEN